MAFLLFIHCEIKDPMEIRKKPIFIIHVMPLNIKRIVNYFYYYMGKLGQPNVHSEDLSIFNNTIKWGF